MANLGFRSPYITQRYLNPAKICLLALIELYCEDAVGDEATLPVLEFITSHIHQDDGFQADDQDDGSQPDDQHDRRQPHNQDDGLQPHDQHDRRQPHDRSDKLQHDDRCDKMDNIMDIVCSIKVFEQALRPHKANCIPGQTVWELFLERIWTIDSLHVLHSFLNARGGLVEPSKEELRAGLDPLPPYSAIYMRLGAGSPFAAFVSKAAFEYTRLRFQEMCTLWTQFVSYRQPTSDHMRRRDESFGRLSFDKVLLSSESDMGGDSTDRLAEVVYPGMVTNLEKPPIPVTTDDLEKLLDFQIDQMQSRLALVPVLHGGRGSRPSRQVCCKMLINNAATEYGIRIPSRIEKKFRQFLDDAVIVPTFRHYLRY